MSTDRTSHPAPGVEGAIPLQDAAIRLHPEDNVAIAKADLPAGSRLDLGTRPGAPAHIPLRQHVPAGHKVALQPIDIGEPVRRYGHTIGFASQAIQPGEHVHTHNLEAGEFERHLDAAPSVQPTSPLAASAGRTFLGYPRADGSVGTRNTIAIIATVNCSAHVTQQIARHFSPEELAPFPNVDGVIALTHPLGCPIQYPTLERTLAGFALHPNVGATVLVGLGCETNQVEALIQAHALGRRPGVGLVIQDLGGIRSAVQAGIAAVTKLLPVVNASQRREQPLSELKVALQCGGSDSWSGVTANPVVGLVADQLVRCGGTVVLAETPEIYGAEHLLARRTISLDVRQRLLARVQWWEQYAQRMGFALDDNRSVGNTSGGLTTIYEKSLGAVAKAGTTPLTAVYDYAEQVTARGFAFMNSPGYDPVAVTGQVAGGCNLVLFTTGRGSVFGFKPAPCIKISSNSATYERMRDDMDLNAGRVLEGAALDEVAAELLDLSVAVASGQPSASESQGVGEAEFCPWNVEGTL
jgi:altronate hydrolase